MTKTPIHIEGIPDSLYAGFWSRIGSLLLDSLIILPVAGILFYLNNRELGNYYITLVPSLLFNFWYNVYLVKKHGGTPGKLILGMKIITSDGRKIDWKQAILRHLVFFVISLFGIFTMMRSIGMAAEWHYNSLNWMQKRQYIGSLSPILFSVYMWLSNIWVYGELIVLLTNKRKRAAHDFIAGTVIIKKKYEESIMNNLFD